MKDKLFRAPVQSLVRFRPSLGQVLTAFNLDSIIQSTQRRPAIQFTLAPAIEAARGSDHSSISSIQLTAQPLKIQGH
jgi:hypothetical protein